MFNNNIKESRKCDCNEDGDIDDTEDCDAKTTFYCYKESGDAKTAFLKNLRSMV